MSKEAAVKALGLRDYAQLLVALGDRGLPLPKLPEHVLEPMIENLVKIMKDDDDQPAPPGCDDN